MAIKKKLRQIAIILWIIISACLIFTSCSKSPEVQIQEQLDLGQKYLTEMNYEQALIAFSKVIELDEKNTLANEGIAQTYELMKKIDKAITYY